MNIVGITQIIKINSENGNFTNGSLFLPSRGRLLFCPQKYLHQYGAEFCRQWTITDHVQLKKVCPQPPQIFNGSTVHFSSNDVLLNSAA